MPNLKKIYGDPWFPIRQRLLDGKPLFRSDVDELLRKHTTPSDLKQVIREYDLGHRRWARGRKPDHQNLRKYMIRFLFWIFQAEEQSRTPQDGERPDTPTGRAIVRLSEMFASSEHTILDYAYGRRHGKNKRKRRKP